MKADTAFQASVLAALVFGAMLVVLVAEALDAYHRRWR
jgi:hypothetical protein